MTAHANAQPDARKDALDALGSSGYGLCIVLLLSGEFLILSMLDELVFHSQPPYLPGWILWIVLEVVMTVLIGRVIWIVCHGGRVGAFQESAAGRARARKTRIVFAVGLSAVLIAAYGVHFVDRKQVMAGEKERAAATLSTIETAFEDAGFYAYGDLPIAIHDPAGYSMNGALYMDEGDQNTQVRVNVDNEGVVTEVIYDMDVDPALPARGEPRAGRSEPRCHARGRIQPRRTLRAAGPRLVRRPSRAVLPSLLSRLPRMRRSLCIHPTLELRRRLYPRRLLDFL